VDLVLNGFQFMDIPWAGNDALVTGCAFFLDDDRKSILPHDDRVEWANRLARSVTDTGIKAGFASTAYEHRGSAFFDTIVLSLQDGLPVAATAVAYGNLADYVTHLEAEILSQLVDRGFVRGRTCRGFHLTRKKSFGKTEAPCVSTCSAVYTGKDPLDDLEAGIDIHVKYPGRHTQTNSGDNSESCETCDGSNHVISPFPRIP
jgi:hypothetical protein